MPLPIFFPPPPRIVLGSMFAEACDLFPKVSRDTQENTHGFPVYICTEKIESVIGFLSAITLFCEA